MNGKKTACLLRIVDTATTTNEQLQLIFSTRKSNKFGKCGPRVCYVKLQWSIMLTFESSNVTIRSLNNFANGYFFFTGFLVLSNLGLVRKSCIALSYPTTIANVYYNLVILVSYGLFCK